MKSLVNLLAALIPATIAIAIAILSVQNATPVSLTFLGLKSIQFPVGVVLAFAAAIGIVGGAIASIVFNTTRRLSQDPLKNNEDL